MAFIRFRANKFDNTQCEGTSRRSVQESNFDYPHTAYFLCKLREHINLGGINYD